MKWFLPVLVALILGCFVFWGVRAFAAEATFETFTTASCANTSTEALAANVGRVSALFINDSTQTIWIKVNEAAVANEGIRLNANGASYYISNLDENLDREAVNCIVASGTGTILVVEWSN